MKPSYFIFLIVLLLLIDLVLRTKLKKLWKVLQLPCNILFGMVSLVYIALLTYNAGEVIFSEVSLIDKAVLILLITGTMALFIYMNEITWKRWWKERGKP